MVGRLQDITGQRTGSSTRVVFVFYIRQRKSLTGISVVRSDSGPNRSGSGARLRKLGLAVICRLFACRSLPDQSGASRVSGVRVSALRVHLKSPVAMPWVPSPQRLDRLATSPCLDRQEPIGFWGEGGPWPTTRGTTKWAFAGPRIGPGDGVVRARAGMGWWGRQVGLARTAP